MGNKLDMTIKHDFGLLIQAFRKYTYRQDTEKQLRLNKMFNKYSIETPLNFESITLSKNNTNAHTNDRDTNIWKEKINLN